MDKRSEKWWVVSIVCASTLLVGLATGFRMETIKLDRVDVSYHFHPLRAVLYLGAFLYMLRMAYLIAGLLIQQAPVLAVVFAIIVPIIMLFTFILLTGRVRIAHPEEAVRIARIHIVLLGLFMACLAAIEIRLVRGAMRFLRAKTS